MTSSTAPKVRRFSLAALALSGSIFLAGCAGNPPTDQMAVTQSAVNAAITAGGPQYSPVETKSAQDKFTKAQMALHDENYEEARKWAEQAEWDARVAERKAQAVKADNAVKDAQKGVQELREEGQFNTQIPRANGQ